MTDHEYNKYYVVINDEDQYSIWRTGREVPDGWHIVGAESPKDECLSYISEHWTDMRPRSVRESAG